MRLDLHLFFRAKVANPGSVDESAFLHPERISATNEIGDFVNQISCAKVLNTRGGDGNQNIVLINLNADICANFQESVSREWLETNGTGGFASSTVAGAHSRRYHGLLTAAMRPPLGRVTMLSKFEETLCIDDERFELSSNQYPLGVFPDGYKFIKSFRLDPFPIWTFEVAGIEIEKTVFMVYGQNTTVCRWSVAGKAPGAGVKMTLELRPLLSFADYHALQHETPDISMDFAASDGCVSIRPLNGLPELFLGHTPAQIERTGYWYRNFEYSAEKDRGFDFQEDLFQPFKLTFDLPGTAVVLASTERQDASGADAFERQEKDRRSKLIKDAPAEGDFKKQLILAADQFIVSRGTGKTVIAGYHWFSDWGRDTMIALNGLALMAKRPDVAKSILLEFSKHVSKGMLPNRFPDANEEAEYNTVDATLWYFEAVRAYAEATGDYDFVENELFPELVEIIIWHMKGTRFNIHVDTDGLLYAGEEGWQLTWMDAKIGDEVFTPRIGKPVEIQALWYNALCIMADLAKRFGDIDGKNQYEATAAVAKQSFTRTFWNEEEECLFDVVANGQNDASIRPNQIFAVSLPHTMVSIGRARKIVEKVEAELLTPFGLRSLSPNDKRYRPIYSGSSYERDSAYHQGTVWAWLIGPFIDSYRKVHPNGHRIDDRIAEILKNFKTHFSVAGLGQISEIFDGDAPHTARGCIAQAWSVAEILRVLH